ncbi:MAG: Asp23/Gls24 family envelope stress response protein [Actinobacteria bacterium]|nr:Asp23/Gls24 family envelope stress response protein [Actinomycetota bacterium]
MQPGQGPSISPDVVTSAVWDAVKQLPGVQDLYRNPLQSLGEKVHLERHGPVRLDTDEDGQVLEIHLVAVAGSDLVAVGEAVAGAGASYLTRTTGNPVSRVEVYIDDVADRPPS